MESQWYLCSIYKCPSNEKSRLKKTDNLSVNYPEKFLGDVGAILGFTSAEDNKKGEGEWYVWLPIIPRVGDTLQFSGWQVQVSRVILSTDWQSESGVKEGLFVSAQIHIRDNVVPDLFTSHFSAEFINSKGSMQDWEDYARRGHDNQYYAWKLKHDSFKMNSKNSDGYYHWHTRIRPVAGDIISVNDSRWKVNYVELTSAGESVDGWLNIEPITD